MGFAVRRRPRAALARSRTHPLAFSSFYEAYAERVLVFFARRVLDAEAALDLTSETFANAYEARQQFRGSTVEEEQGWLFAIARSELSDFWRRGRAETAAVRRLGVDVPPMTDADLERIEDLAEVTTIARDLETAMRQLPSQQAAAVQLRVMGELSYEEIAARLDIAPDAVRARVSRGLRALAEIAHDAADGGAGRD